MLVVNNRFFENTMLHSHSMQMTAFHQGFTFLPEMAVNKGVGKAENLTLARLEDEYYRKIGVVWRKTSMRNALYHQLCRVITELLA